MADRNVTHRISPLQKGIFCDVTRAFNGTCGPLASRRNDNCQFTGKNKTAVIRSIQ